MRDHGVRSTKRDRTAEPSKPQCQEWLPRELPESLERIFAQCRGDGTRQLDTAAPQPDPFARRSRTLVQRIGNRRLDDAMDVALFEEELRDGDEPRKGALAHVALRTG